VVGPIDAHKLETISLFFDGMLGRLLPSTEKKRECITQLISMLSSAWCFVSGFVGESNADNRQKALAKAAMSMVTPDNAIQLDTLGEAAKRFLETNPHDVGTLVLLSNLSTVQSLSSNDSSKWVANACKQLQNHGIELQ